MRFLAEFVLRSRLRAISIALLFSIIPFLSWVGGAIIGLTTLRKGVMDGLIVIVGVVLPLIVGGLFGKEVVLFYAYNILYSSLIVWGMALILRRWSSWRLVLQISALLGSIFVLVVHLYDPEITAVWAALIKQYLSVLGDATLKAKLASPEVAAVMDVMARIFTGVQVVLALITGLFSLFIARWWQAMLYNPGGLGQELAALRLGLPEVGVACAIALAAFLGVSVCVDMLPVLALLFILPGICLVHTVIVSSTSKPWIGLFLLYALLVFFFKYTAMMLIILALLDSVIDIRSRFVNPFFNNLTKR